MFRTHQNVEKFSETIKQRKTIVCDKEGDHWKQQNLCHRVNELLKCKNQEHSRLVAIGKVFNHLLDNLEKVPILFDVEDDVTKKQSADLKPYLDLSDTVIAELKLCETKEIREQLESIRVKVIGLKYRIGAIHGGLDPQKIINEETCKQLIDLADRWKSKQKLYPKKDKRLNLRDIQKLVDTCQYPAFVDMLMYSPVLQELFFKWTIRDNNGVPQLIEFPGLCKKLRTSFLEKRLGRLFPEELAIKKSMIGETAWKKDIRLPFYDGVKTSQISILDDSEEVILNNNWRLTIKEIFAIFAYKSIDPGNISIFGSHGIMNWHIYECGMWNPRTKTYDRPNLQSKDWWKELPSFETLSRREVADRYGVTLKPGEWMKCLKASRESLDYAIFGRHSYFELVIPLENGMFGIHPFGFFPYHYPAGKLQQMHLITQTVPGRIAYIDENTCYSQRQQATLPKVISEEQGKFILEEIRADILRSLVGELPFQLKGENCSFWAQKIFNSDEHIKSNFFEMPVLEMKPCHTVIDKMMELPTPMANGILMGLRFFANRDGMHIPAAGEKIYKISSFAKDIHEETQLQPGLLFEKIEEGKLNGRISFGN